VQTANALPFNIGRFDKGTPLVIGHNVTVLSNVTTDDSIPVAVPVPRVNEGSLFLFRNDFRMLLYILHFRFFIFIFFNRTEQSHQITTEGANSNKDEIVNANSPCTKENLQKGLLYHEYKKDANKFIHCQGVGKHKLITCPLNMKWSQHYQQCLEGLDVHSSSGKRIWGL
jgi:hypothetical protein